MARRGIFSPEEERDWAQKVALQELSRLSVVLDEEQLQAAIGMAEEAITAAAKLSREFGGFWEIYAAAAVKEWRAKAYARALKTVTDAGNALEAERFYSAHKNELGAAAAPAARGA